MKNLLFTITFLFAGSLIFAQELEEMNPGIPAENRQNEIQEESPFLIPLSLSSPGSQLGPLQIDRYKIDINLMDIGFPSEEETDPIDIQAIAKAEQMRKRSYYRDIKAPARQLQQIRSHVQVFSYQGSDYNRVHGYQFDSRNTPDGGIRNDAWQDMRQPLLNPYSRIYGNPFYYNSYPYRYGGYQGNPYYYYRR